MPRSFRFDVTVVGSGPNGLAAALVAAREGLSVRVVEAESFVGGGLRSAEVVESGFLNDICSAVHPWAVASPFFRAYGLLDKVRFVVPPVSYAHVGMKTDALLAYRSLERTASELGPDGHDWLRGLGPLVGRANDVVRLSMWPPIGARISSTHLRLGAEAMRRAIRASLHPTGGGRSDALFAGVAAHAVGEYPSLASTLVGVSLATIAHDTGWPIPIGGSQAIADVMVADLVKRGTAFELGRRIARLEEVSDSRATILDVTPRSFVRMTGGRMRARDERRYSGFTYGPGIAKLDLTLDGPVPWRDSRLTEAGTIHFGGTASEVAFAERQIARGTHPRKPFIVLSQPTMFDSTRAPQGKHVVWAYAHVPAGSSRNVEREILSAIEAEAPGARDLIRASRHMTANELGQYNTNYVGGDVGAGATVLRQVLARPVATANPWRTPVPGVYLGSASTAPGPGVHGMSGWHAARVALMDMFGITVSQ